MSEIKLTLHEGAAASLILRGAQQLNEGETYTLTVRPVKVGRGRVVLYPAVCDFAPSGHLRVAVKPIKHSKAKSKRAR